MTPVGFISEKEKEKSVYDILDKNGYNEYLNKNKGMPKLFKYNNV
jgi:hypothetical protein